MHLDPQTDPLTSLSSVDYHYKIAVLGFEWVDRRCIQDQQFGRNVWKSTG